MTATQPDPGTLERAHAERAQAHAAARPAPRAHPGLARALLAGLIVFLTSAAGQLVAGEAMRARLAAWNAQAVAALDGLRPEALVQDFASRWQEEHVLRALQWDAPFNLDEAWRRDTGKTRGVEVRGPVELPPRAIEGGGKSLRSRLLGVPDALLYSARRVAANGWLGIFVLAIAALLAIGALSEGPRLLGILLFLPLTSSIGFAITLLAHGAMWLLPGIVAAAALAALAGAIPPLLWALHSAWAPTTHRTGE